jgi:hypothetical protein
MSRTLPAIKPGLREVFSMVLQRPIDVSTEAERLGFHISETIVDGAIVWAWARGADIDWPSFPTKGEAYGWMEDQIRHCTLFDR